MDQKKIDELFKDLPDSPETTKFLNDYIALMDTRTDLWQSGWRDSEAREDMARLMKSMPGYARGLPEVWQNHIGRMVERYQEHQGRSGPGGEKPPRHTLDPASAREFGRVFGHDDGVMRGIGDYWKSTGDNAEAAQAYRRAVLVNPKNTEALNGLAQSQLAMGDISGAVETGLRTLEVNPADPQARSLVSMYKGRANPSDAGIAGGGAPAPSQGAPPANFRQFSDPVDIKQNKAQPNVTDAQLAAAGLANQAERYISVRDAARAEEAAAKAMEADPKNKKALRALMRSLFMQHKFAQALSVADRGLAMYPEDPMLSVMKANSLSLLGRYQDALSAAEFGLAKNPGNADLLLSKGFALNRFGRYEEARAALREAENDPAAARFARAALAQSDEDMGSFFTSALLGEPRETAKKPGPGQDSPIGRRAAIAAAVAAGLGLIFFGFLRSGDWAESMRRSLGRLGSASPSVQPMAAPPAPDGLTASRIRIDKKIGQGGMGIVYLGTDMSLDRPVAIKKMREEIRSDPRERERFLREAKTVAAMHHPHIVEIYSIIEDGSDVYLVFEYVTGKTVHDLTYERGTLPFAYAVGVVRAVASALDYAHRRGVIHRDLKPSNIMVEDEGMVKVMDFGVARTAKDSLSRMSMTNTVVGTPPYMAPEQEQGIVRKESDVYALAICLYEMVVGQLPFQGVGAGMLMAKLNGTFVPPSRLVQGLPEGFDRVMAAALHPDPEKRLQTAGDLVKALDSLPVA
ncbi:MAG: protein kinase [Elusimicrobia bacterium]|nr:protein kinase [Elusimicrobiota bacterium]